MEELYTESLFKSAPEKESERPVAVFEVAAATAPPPKEAAAPFQLYATLELLKEQVGEAFKNEKYELNRVSKIRKMFEEKQFFEAYVELSALEEQLERL